MKDVKELTLQDAAADIRNTCELDPDRRPFFFLVGAGVSYPPVPLASAIVDDCKQRAQKYRALDEPDNKNPIADYSFWFEKAYPAPADRQRYLRSLIEGRFISQANFYLAHLLLDRRISNIVVTTNFDDFLSRALTLFGQSHIVCDHPETVERIDPERGDLQIIHVHGTYWFYDCCNLKGEIKQRSHRSTKTFFSMADLLGRIGVNRSPLVVGYSGWEDDVVMSALRQRLKSDLPYNLYWFCYRRNEASRLPDWLKFHANVFFVLPPLPKAAREAVAAPAGEGGKAAVELQTQPGTSPQSNIDGKTVDPALPAHAVFEALIRAFALETPTLLKDPLGFLAGHLRAALPPQQAGTAERDIYFIGTVIERVEHAKQKLEESVQAVEVQLEEVRDALRRSQHREAVQKGSVIRRGDLDAQQLRDLSDAMWTAAVGLLDNSAEELQGYELVIAICETLAQKGFGDAALAARAAKALRYKGLTLSNLGRSEEALAVYEEVLKRFAGATEAALREQVARSMVHKAYVLGQLGRVEDAIAASEELVKCFAGATDYALREQVAIALFDKGVWLAQLGRFADGIAAYDQVTSLFGDAAELALRTEVAMALVNKSDAMERSGRREESVVVCEETVKRFGDAAEPALRRQVAMALFNKGIWLARLGRYAEAVAAGEDLDKRFGEAAEPAVREYVAMALLNRGFALGQLDRREDEIAVYDDLVKRFEEAAEPALREQVAKALFNKGFSLEQLGRREDELAAYDEVLRRFGAATDPALQQWVAQTLVNKGIVADRLGRNPDAVAAFEEVVRRYGESSDSVLRDQAGRALNGIGFSLLGDAKRAWAGGDPQTARTRLVQAREKVAAALDRAPENPYVLGNLGYIDFLLGDKEKAAASLARAIALGGEDIRQAELKDAELHPLPQDAEFKEMVRSVPAPPTDQPKAKAATA